MRNHLFKILFFVLIAFSSCVPSRSFVASSYEPLVIDKKGEKQIAASFRALKYYQLDFAYAVSSKFVLKASTAGFIRFFNGNLSFLYNKTFHKSAVYFGPNFSYQSNYFGINFTNFSGTLYRFNHYGCEYVSLGGVFGFALNKGNFRKHHFLVKPQYNIVQKYSYNNLISDRYYATTNETLNYRIPNFLSFEISYVLLKETDKKNFYKFQIGANFTEKTFTHNYSYYPGYTPYSHSSGQAKDFKNSTTKHPLSWPINISFGYIFSSKKESKKIEEVN